jgi:hypothetical protein
MALQIVSMAISGAQQLRPMLQPVQQVAQQQVAQPPQPIPQQPGDEVRYWFDQSRGQWCCTRNGALYVWGPTR